MKRDVVEINTTTYSKALIVVLISAITPGINVAFGSLFSQVEVVLVASTKLFLL